MVGYNSNGRPVLKIFGAGPFALHTPGGVHKYIGEDACRGMLTSYPFKPVVEFADDVPGKIKRNFRDAISGMPLPGGMQGAA